MARHNGYLSLAELPLGYAGEVVTLEVSGPTRRRLLDLGLIPGTRVAAVRRSPAGDPTAFNIRGALIALRAEDGRRIIVKPLSDAGKDKYLDQQTTGSGAGRQPQYRQIHHFQHPHRA